MPNRTERGVMILGILITIMVTGWAYAKQADQGQPTSGPAASVPSVQVPGTPATTGTVPTTAAVPVTEVPSPAEPDHAKEQMMWALVMVQLLNILKKTSWFPWLTETSEAHIQAAWGFIMAGATAVGIHIAVQGSILDGGATLTISNITFDAIKDVGWQWASQQGIYDLLKKAKAGV